MFRNWNSFLCNSIDGSVLYDTIRYDVQVLNVQSKNWLIASLVYVDTIFILQLFDVIKLCVGLCIDSALRSVRFVNKAVVVFRPS